MNRKHTVRSSGIFPQCWPTIRCVCGIRSMSR